MASIPFITVIMICCISPAIGFGRNFWNFREKVEEHKDKVYQKLQKQHFFKEPLDVLSAPPADQYLTQPLDHFDPAVQKSYQQRFWANPQYWKGPDSPVFLFIGGEGSLSYNAATRGEHVDLAMKYGALLFAVEHRFYGASINEDGLKLENLQYLSSQQALADLASFHDYASMKFKLTEKNAWVCFGGSYPGALSAWFRVKYPHLVYAAVASSAPVEAQLNYEGYNDVVAQSMADPKVEGSKECANYIKQAFATIDKMLDNRQTQDLEMDFKSCKPLQDDRDVYQFVSNLADMFMGVVQYNNEVDGYNISMVCQKMTAQDDPYHSLIKLNDDFLSDMGEKCVDNSWSTFISQISNTTVDKTKGGVSIRSWLYQTCTQFGYYQTCDPDTSCLFSKRMILEPNLKICDMIFKIPPGVTASQIDFTNVYYGSDRPKGTRIIFVNGSIDPWHALSVLEDLSDSEVAIYIPGTAHCANMNSDRPNDPPELRQARQEIDSQLGKWLNDFRRINKKDSTLYFKQL